MRLFEHGAGEQVDGGPSNRQVEIGGAGRGGCLGQLTQGFNAARLSCFHCVFMDNLAPKEETKMTKTIGSMVAVFSLIFMLGGCRAITGETLGEHIDDTTITTSVKTK